MKTCVDQDLCVGCGMCTNIAPDVFALNSDGKAEVISDAAANANRSGAAEAAGACPMEAISQE